MQIKPLQPKMYLTKPFYPDKDEVLHTNLGPMKQEEDGEHMIAIDARIYTVTPFNPIKR